jgi:hypothetical protein
LLTVSKAAAAGMASATTAVLGSYFGVLGTVGAAAATSAVSALSSEVYQRSIERAANRLRPRAATAGAPAGGVPDRAPAPRGSMLPAVIVGTVVVFALAIGIVSGIEYVRGAPLSGGQRGTTSLGDLVHGGVAPVTDDVPLVGGLLGSSSSGSGGNSDSGDSGHSGKHHDNGGVVGGLLSGL